MAVPVRAMAMKAVILMRVMSPEAVPQETMAPLVTIVVNKINMIV